MEPEKNYINMHGENFIIIFTTLSVVIWFSAGTLGISATLVYVITMPVGICNTVNIAIAPTLWSSKRFYAVSLFFLYPIVNFTTQCHKNRHTDIANFSLLVFR